MNVLVVLDDPPYGVARSFDAVRRAGSSASREQVAVRVFQIGDAAGCAVSGEKVPNGYDHLDRMIRATPRHGADQTITSCS